MYTGKMDTNKKLGEKGINGGKCFCVVSGFNYFVINEYYAKLS